MSSTFHVNLMIILNMEDMIMPNSLLKQNWIALILPKDRLCGWAEFVHTVTEGIIIFGLLGVRGFYKKPFKLNWAFGLKAVCKFYHGVSRGELLHVKRHTFQTVWKETNNYCPKKKDSFRQQAPSPPFPPSGI